VDALTPTITTVAGNGSEGYAGDGGPAVSANLNQPIAVALDSTGNLFIADSRNYRVRRVDVRTGIITTVAGNGTWYDRQNGVPATSTAVEPSSVAVDAAGNLFIADPGDNRIRRVDLQTRVILLTAGNGQPGYSGDGGPATSASLNEPQGVAVDNAGSLLIADTANNRIRRVVFSSGPRLVLSQTVLSFTSAGSQTVSVTSSGAVLNFTASASTTSGGNWLSVSPTSGATPASVSISVDPGALPPADYSGTVSITSLGAGNSPQSVAVSLTVSVAPKLTIKNISLPVAEVGVPYGPVQFTTTGGSGATIWSQTGLPAVTGISLSTTGILSGTPAAGHEHPYPFTVTARNSGMGATAQFTLTISGVNVIGVLNYQLVPSGGADLSGKRVVVVANDTSSSASVQIVPSVQWITVSTNQVTLADSSSSQPVSVQIDRTKLPPNTSYASGRISLRGLSSPKEIDVNVALQDQPGLPLLSRKGMTFYVQQSQIRAENGNLEQTITIINDGPRPVDWSITKSDSFISADPNSGLQLPPGSSTNVKVTVTDRDLTIGNWQALLSFLFNETSLAELPVLVVISADVLPSELLLDQTGLIFSGAEKQSVKIYNYTSQDWWVSLLPNDQWIKVSTNAATLTQRGATSFDVSVDPAMLLDSGLVRTKIKVGFQNSSQPTPLFREVEVLAIGSLMAPRAEASVPAAASVSASQCVPASLRAVFSSLSEGQAVPAGLPGQVDVKISDNCGNAITTGAAAVLFSNGDPPVPLLPDGTGSWQGTWVPGTGKDVALFMGAVSGPGSAFGTATRSVQLDSSLTRLPTLPSGAVLNAASLVPSVDRVAPGSIISIFGNQLAAETAAASGSLPLSLGSAKVRIGKTALPLFYVSPDQINALVPANIQLDPSTSLVVENSGFQSVPLPVVSLGTDPGIFKGALVSAATGKTVSPAAPAQRGDTISIYCTGLGPVSESLDPTVPAPTDHLVYSKPVAVFIQGASGQWISSYVSFAGLAPGYFGLYQVNVQIPNDAATGEEVELYIQSGVRESNHVFLSVR
jgi:uncharacterized protein (TIGR03437 family)